MACEVCLGKGSRPCPVCGEEPKKIDCPNCDGIGLVNCTAFKLNSREIIDVSAQTYIDLPYDEEEAHLWEHKMFKGDADICPICNGHGKVYEIEGEYMPVK